jgi:two-component system phosphate regulon response regulator PhoB
MDHTPATFPKGLKVLIVDDHDLIRKNIAKVLRRLDFGEIFECHNTKDARMILETQGADLIICDLELNLGSGLELLDHVRGLDTRSDIPFIIVTGAADKEDIVKAVDKGAEDYIIKPFQPEDLEAKIFKVMSQYHSPGPVLSRLRHAEKMIQSANLDKALVLIQDALKLKDSPRGHHLEAVVLVKQNQMEAAVQKLLENIRNAPSYLKNYVTLANIYIESKDYPNAIRALSQELDLNPKQAMRQIKLANMLLKEGHNRQAIEHYRLALLENSRNAEALYGMGTAHAMAENMDKSIYYFKRYRRHHPKDSRPLKAIVQFAERFEKLRIAEIVLIDEKKTHPERMDTYMILAEFYFKQAKEELAITTLEGAIKRKPDFAPAHVMLANYYKQNGDMESAVKAIKRYIAVAKDPNSYIFMGRFFMEVGKPSLAISTLHQGMEANADAQLLFPLLLQATLKTKQLAKTYFVRERLKLTNPDLELPAAVDQIDSMILARRHTKIKGPAAS